LLVSGASVCAFACLRCDLQCRIEMILRSKVAFTLA
jgi:hypothetical protein